MNNNPLVSIIIPTYNSLKYLNDSIKSAANQSYQNIEIILIDDGSTDGTQEEFLNFEKFGVKCIYQENKGVSSARNRGLKECKGEYIQFLDADDIIHLEKIQKQVNKMLSSNAEISFTAFEEFNESIKNTTPFPYNHFNYSTTASGEELMISFGTNKWIVPVHGWLTKKTLLDKAGFWDTTLEVGEDLEYFARVLLLAKKVICIDKIFAFYRRTDLDSLSKANSEIKIMSNFAAWKKINVLCGSSTNKKLSIYPKFGFILVFMHSINFSPEIAKKIAKEFDQINQVSYSFKNRYYTMFVNFLGLYIGFKIHNLIKKLHLD